MVSTLGRRDPDSPEPVSPVADAPRVDPQHAPEPPIQAAVQPDQAAQEPPPEDEGPNLESRIKLVTSVVAPTTVLTALLFYYGYVATAAEYGYFGISLGSLDLSYQDFLLKSVGALFVPLGLTFLLMLLVLWGHSAVRRRVASRTPGVGLRRVALGVLVGGAIVFVRGVVGVVVPDIARTEPIATTPICLGVGVAAVAYARYLLDAPRRQGPRRRPWTESASLAVVIALVVLSVFWAANSFAGAYGRGRAQVVADRLWDRPAVVLDTTDRLYVAYAGIDETRLPAGEEQRFRYRYRGLRLLIESNGRLFLLPEQWDSDSGAALVVPSDGNIRLQFYRTGRP